jgi:hypothetical protein
MNAISRRLHRLILRAYPPGFRREFGEEMFRLVVDRHRFEQIPAWRLLLGEIIDAGRSAPRLRWEESIVNRVVIVTVLGTAAVAAAIAFGPYALIPIVGIALVAAVVAVRDDRPVASAKSRRARSVLLVVAGVSLAVGIGVIASADGELSELAWAVAALSIVLGVGSAIASLLLPPRRTKSVSRI